MNDKLKNAGLDVLSLAVSGALTGLGTVATGDLLKDVQIGLWAALFIVFKAANPADAAYGVTRKE